MQSENAIQYTIETLDGGVRPATFLFDGGNREPLVEEFEDILANSPGNAAEIVKALNRFSESEPNMRFCDFKPGVPEPASDRMVLVARRRESSAGIRIAFSR